MQGKLPAFGGIFFWSTKDTKEHEGHKRRIAAEARRRREKFYYNTLHLRASATILFTNIKNYYLQTS
jgi:hypothetical protein